MANRNSVALGVLLATLLPHGAASTVNNSLPCNPGGVIDQSITIGELTNLCLRFNGATEMLFTPAADAYSAVQVVGCACMGEKRCADTDGVLR